MIEDAVRAAMKKQKVPEKLAPPIGMNLFRLICHRVREGHRMYLNVHSADTVPLDIEAWFAKKTANGKKLGKFRVSPVRKRKGEGRQ